MTKEERVEFIKDKLAPLFDGMNANDVRVIIDETWELEKYIFSRFTMSLEKENRTVAD